ncbi:sigma factor-like helix-turn-helix DNA-binding protein [Erythrobacter sp.]|jgi:DNA-binding CsgD family transcriptional regulator|uniref:sigma factor-like helix-turn-helix DNA-binding protein n=1 Tax=Erythrobacter sp. TaxID=1042 RepID=UPI002EC72737|nr:LuxR C-terminal-related transcriptional regulator [Erythrobacter sp.]
MDANPAIAKLTERERQVLRLWLDHKTAKEIALDLGITHHAVEKRLMMARVKLDVGSSLEAARLLAEAERYERAVAGPPELQSAQAPGKSWRSRPLVFGALAMIFASLLAVLLTTASQPDEPREIAIENNPERLFDHLDADGSGFLEEPESPFVTMAFIDDDASPELEGTAILGDGTDPEQIARFYAEADGDGDRRISFREYFAWSEARLAELGIEVQHVTKFLVTPES